MVDLLCRVILRNLFNCTPVGLSLSVCVGDVSVAISGNGNSCILLRGIWFN